MGLCKQTGLVLCRGRAPGDGAARPTWHKRGALSFLDHVLVSRRAFSVFGVALCPRAAPFVMILTMNFSVSQCLMTTLNPHQPSPAHCSHALHVIFACSRNMQKHFSNHHQPLTCLLVSVHRNVVASHMLISCSLMQKRQHAAIASGARRKERFCRTGRSVTIRRDAQWFDTACRAAHRPYWRARRRATATIEFRDAERHYKQLVSSGQHQWQQRQLDRKLADGSLQPESSAPAPQGSSRPLPAVLLDHPAWDSFLRGLASYRRRRRKTAN